MAFLVRLGGVDVSIAVENISIANRISSRPSARLVLRLALLPSSAVDLGGQLDVSDPDSGAPVFTGEAVRSSVEREFVHVEAMTALDLSDTGVSRSALFGLAPVEQIRTLLLQAGMAESQFDLGDRPTPQMEYFEVIFPVIGITVHGRHHDGMAAFLEPTVLQRHPWFQSGAVKSDLTSEFFRADSFVLIGTAAAWVSDAEDDAYPRAIESVARITVDRRFTSLLRPDGSAAPYLRSDARVTPRVRPLAMVRGVVSGRGWVRELASPSRLDPIRLPANPFAVPVAPLPDDLHQCMLSLYRSVAADQPLPRSLAFWDAVEFYTANIDAPHLFSKSDHKVLLRQVIRSSSWSLAQRERLIQAKNMLNSMPLLARLRRRLLLDKVPFVEDEFSAVKRLRTSRNDAVHGRGGTSDPSDSDYRTAVRLLARAFVYSSASASGARP